jgi:uncharacterized protein
MVEKIGRNDPCPCGSGKKYKNCCLTKKKLGLKGMSVKWISKPQEKKVLPNLLERTFGNSIEEAKGSEYEPKKEDL